MGRRVLDFVFLIAILSLLTTVSAHAQSSDAKALLEQSAKAMGGMETLRSLKNQVVESEGRQFDSSSTPRPGGPTREITTFHSTLTRYLTQPKMRLVWDS